MGSLALPVFIFQSIVPSHWMEKKRPWQDQGSQETLGLAEVWSRWVSMASAQSSHFWSPWMEDVEAMLLEAMETRGPWG